MDKYLVVNELEKSYKEKVLDGVTFNICKNEKVALVGFNGVGKSTCVDIISDVIKYDSGGYKKNVNTSTCFSSPFLPDYISIWELCKYRKLDLQKLDFYLSKFDAMKYKNRLIKYLSSGTKKKIELIFTLLSKSELIILDEPTVALDFTSVVTLSDIVKDDQRTFLIVSHDFQFLNSFVERVLVLGNGKIEKDIKYNNDNLLNIKEIFKLLSKENIDENNI